MPNIQPATQVFLNPVTRNPHPVTHAFSNIEECYDKCIKTCTKIYAAAIKNPTTTQISSFHSFIHGFHMISSNMISFYIRWQFYEPLKWCVYKPAKYLITHPEKVPTIITQGFLNMFKLLLDMSSGLLLGMDMFPYSSDSDFALLFIVTCSGSIAGSLSRNQALFNIKHISNIHLGVKQKIIIGSIVLIGSALLGKITTGNEGAKKASYGALIGFSWTFVGMSVLTPAIKIVERSILMPAIKINEHIMRNSMQFFIGKAITILNATNSYIKSTITKT